MKRDIPPTTYTKKVNDSRGKERGKFLFGARCQACHGRGGIGAPATRVKLNEVASSLPDGDLRDFIGNGQVNLKMPSFAKTLKPDELDDIVAFIRSWSPAGAPSAN